MKLPRRVVIRSGSSPSSGPVGDGGRLPRQHGAPLLTTTGARTGRRWAVPLTYLPDGDRYIVTAGNAGSGRHPAWYYNLVANPDVTVEVGSEAFRAVAVIADEAERGALYERFAAAYPQLGGYQAQSTRQIPVVILTPRQAVTPVIGSPPKTPATRPAQRGPRPRPAPRRPCPHSAHARRHRLQGSRQQLSQPEADLPSTDAMHPRVWVKRILQECATIAVQV